MTKRMIASLLLLMCLSLPLTGYAEELSAPTVSASAGQWMPEPSDSFNDGLKRVLQKVLPAIQKEMRASVKTGIAVFACVMLVSILQTNGDGFSPAEMGGGVCIAILLIRNSNAMIGLTTDTITEISEYSKLFLPVITAASAAQGAMTSSGALFLGTSAFSAFLCGVLRQILLPAIYLFLAASIANCAVGEAALKNVKKQFQKFSAWFLKTVITLFLSYMGITGAISGTTDKAALKMAKAAISTAVPVIGGTLADASEAVLISAGLAKNAIGIYGIFAFLAIFLSPFIRIGAQYLTLKATASVCAITDCKHLTELVGDFCTVMGLLLAMAGSMCVLSLIGTVCFMKGVG